MSNKICPLCDQVPLTPCQNSDYSCACERCISAYLDRRLIRSSAPIEDTSTVLGRIREAHVRFNCVPKVDTNGNVTVSDQSGATYTIDCSPKTISERAHKLLSALVLQTEHFGEKIDICEPDFPLAYVDDFLQLQPYVDYLGELGYVTILSKLSSRIRIKVNAAGFDAVKKSELLPPVTVFLSSTCHDLRDCRSELIRFIEAAGCVVRASDDPARFDVSPTDDSIQSCLMNVKRSDVVFCLIDRRYGPPLPDGNFRDISATHAEIRYARQLSIPIYFFIRKDALVEYSILRKNPDAETVWVEPNDKSRRRDWVSFVDEYIRLPSEGGKSNWFDQFSSVVDLKSIVGLRIAHIRGNSNRRSDA